MLLSDLNITHTMKALSALLLLLSSSSAYAAINIANILIEYDLYAEGDGLVTYDKSSDLDWLDLTGRGGVAYNSALNGLSDEWRYATNAEVESLFEMLFEGYYATDPSKDWSSSTASPYADQATDILTFQSLFGVSDYNSEISISYIYGAYLDETANLRLMGARISDDQAGHAIFGLEYPTNLDPNATHNTNLAPLVVRASNVPEHSTYALLLGIVSMAIAARRRLN